MVIFDNQEGYFYWIFIIIIIIIILFDKWTLGRNKGVKSHSSL